MARNNWAVSDRFVTGRYRSHRAAVYRVGPSASISFATTPIDIVARRNGRRARVGEIASRSTQYLPGAIGHRAAVSERREPFSGGAGDAAGPNSSAAHPASVRTAIAGIKQMLYGNFY